MEILKKNRLLPEQWDRGGGFAQAGESYAIQDLIMMEGAESTVSAISHLNYEFPGAKTGFFGFPHPSLTRLQLRLYNGVNSNS